MTQGEAETPLENWRNITEGGVGKKIILDLARRNVRKEDAIAQMSHEETELTVPVRMVDMRCLLMMYLEPAEQQQ